MGRAARIPRSHVHRGHRTNPIACRPVRILFLSQRVPYPPNRGDKITTWRLIERMARDHEVSVVAFAHDEADEVAVKHLIDKGFDTAFVTHRSLPARLKSLPLLVTKKPLTLGYYGSKALQAEVDQRIGEADLVYAYSSSMGAFMIEPRQAARDAFCRARFGQVAPVLRTHGAAPASGSTAANGRRCVSSSVASPPFVAQTSCARRSRRRSSRSRFRARRAR